MKYIIHWNKCICDTKRQFIYQSAWQVSQKGNFRHWSAVTACSLNLNLSLNQWFKFYLGTHKLPVSIFPSCAAGPSGITLFTCRNSSGSSPPMIVKPNPMLLFCRAVDRKVPFSWVGSLVNNGFSVGLQIQKNDILDIYHYVSHCVDSVLYIIHLCNTHEYSSNVTFVSQT